jgi:STE24 endopeptidase
LIGWTLLGGLDALNQFVMHLIQPRWGSLAYELALLSAFVSIGALLDLPLDVYNTFRIEQRFAFNRMTWRLYASDAVKGALVLMVIGLPLACLILWIMGAAGGGWWLWAWATWVAFNLLVLVLYPTLIAPMFNRFVPLADDVLLERVTSLMARCGFAAKGLFVMDGGRRSAHANAYFTGLGAAKRVVFFDTLLAKLTPVEVEAVLAHELGHFKHKHVLKRMATMFAVSLAALALLGWISQQSWFFVGLGARPALATPNNALSLILFILAAPLVTFFAGPALAKSSRRHEYEADAFACEKADAGALASALLKLHEDNASTLTPDPWYASFYYSHPPASQRLAALAGRSASALT